MTRAPLVVGTASVLQLPWQLREPRLGALLRPGTAAERLDAEADIARAVRVSRRVLALLARLPRSPWRNSCLFRSAAECLILRRYGAGAHVQLGVRPDPSSPDGVAAHAWVVTDDGAASDPTSALYRVLHRAGSP